MMTRNWSDNIKIIKTFMVYQWHDKYKTMFIDMYTALLSQKAVSNNGVFLRKINKKVTLCIGSYIIIILMIKITHYKLYKYN
jgi:hypothetical protein